MDEMESVSCKNILKVGIYLRLSDEDKNKVNRSDDSESIKNQSNLLMEEISKYADKNEIQSVTKLDKSEIFSKYKVLFKLECVIVNEFIDKIFIGKVKDDKTRDIKIIWNIE